MTKRRRKKKKKKKKKDKWKWTPDIRFGAIKCAQQDAGKHPESSFWFSPIQRTEALRAH